MELSAWVPGTERGAHTALRQPTGPSGDCQGCVRGEDSGRTRQSRAVGPGGRPPPCPDVGPVWGTVPVLGLRPQSLGPAAPGCHTHMWPPGATFPAEAQPPPTAWISVLDLPGEGAQRPGAQVKASRLFPSQIPLEVNGRVQREPRGSGPQLPTPTHCVCRGGTQVAADPSPPHLPSAGGAPTCLPGRTASSRMIKHCLHGVMGRELIHYLFFF